MLHFPGSIVLLCRSVPYLPTPLCLAFDFVMAKDLLIQNTEVNVLSAVYLSHVFPSPNLQGKMNT